jgi:hypothetical protein
MSPLRTQYRASVVGFSVETIRQSYFIVTSWFSGKSKYIEPPKTDRPKVVIVEGA